MNEYQEQKLTDRHVGTSGVPIEVEQRQLDERARCECRTGQPGNHEPFCPAHRYRWEYEQDEKAAHEALDELGAPRAEPPPSDMVLSVAGRVRYLAAAEPRGEERVRAVLDHIERVWVNCRDHHAPLARAGGDTIATHQYDAKARQAHDFARRLREALGDGPPREPSGAVSVREDDA